MSQTIAPETTDELVTSLDDPLERLLAFTPTTLPVLSLYLNTQAGATGRAQYGDFVKKELPARARAFAPGTPERASFDADVERINAWLAGDHIQTAANGVALFACHGVDAFFEAVQLTTPLDEHNFYVYSQPHLYHLTRLDDQFPRYAALVTDANTARIFVFGLGQALDSEKVKGKKMQRVKVGGWSQARYQRRVDNAHKEHAKECIERLDKLVAAEGIQHVMLAGDPAIIPVLQEQLPKHLAEKVVDVLQLDTKANERDIFQQTLAAFQEKDHATDAAKVRQALDLYGAGGLGVAGINETLEALANGQVDELLVSANLEQMAGEACVDPLLALEVPDIEGSTESDHCRPVLVADLLVTKAKQTDATVRIIEDPELLAGVGGVAAFLRWRA